ncbi:MAG: hypothetical protein EBW11_00135 [Betaproteobacteria bacterium]|nr:hypothetical protein [Betaproteobacteria bacterium]
MADSLLEALQGLQISPLENPYGLGAAALAKQSPGLLNPYGSVGSNLAIGLGSLLAQGLLASQAQSQAAEETLRARKLALELEGMSPVDRLGAIERIEEPRIQNRLLNYDAITRALSGQNDLDYQQKSRLAALETAEKKKQFEDQQSAELRKLLALRYNVMPEDLPAAIEQQKQQDAQSLQPGAKTTDISNDLPGIPNIFDRKEQLIRNYRFKHGMTPNEAGQQAEKDLAAERQMNKPIIDSLSAARTRADTLESIASKAKTAMTKAGETGGLPLFAGIRDLLSQVYQMVPTSGGAEEAQQRAATSQLASVKSEVSSLSKSPGAVSDFESQMYIGSGPNESKTPQENAAIIKNMEVFADLEREYANFMERYVQAGSTVGANEIWEQYKRNEVFPNGMINYNKRSFKDWYNRSAGTTTPTDEAAKLQRLKEVQQQIAELKAKMGAQ